MFNEIKENVYLAIPKRIRRSFCKVVGHKYKDAHGIWGKSYYFCQRCGKEPKKDYKLI